MERTRTQMLKALHQISAPIPDDQQTTTPLLQGQHGRASYTDDEDEEEAEAVLEGAVLGEDTTTAKEGEREGTKYAIA
jgi:hypothetical protein